MSYILVDAMNLFFRAKHVVRGDIDTKIGMAMHIIFSSVNKVYRDLGGNHVVFCFEGHSWRKGVYTPYKQNRAEKMSKRTLQEIADDDEFFAAFGEFQEYITNHTNVTVLQSKNCEADDYIARWVQLHPNSNHVIVSSDSDFYQLLASNVSQYNGITNQHIKLDGIVDDRNRPVIDKKTNEQKQIGDPAWILFEKCMRGDTSDNIFSAYPGVRKKGTKNKVGLLEAFADRTTKGFNWNNMMLQRWVDHNDEEHLVHDDYMRNVELVDLTKQPEHILVELDAAITQAVSAPPKSQVGLGFIRFCKKFDLARTGENAEAHVAYLGASYG
jgi:5'-3' exonuclease